MTTDLPFPEALQAQLDEREWSVRELGRRCRAELDWGSHATVSHAMIGKIDVTAKMLESFAKVMRIDPTYFAEYRLMKARDSLDPRVVGLKKALKNLNAAHPAARK